MARVEEIEKAVKSLPASELKRFREWFEVFDAESWDAQVEADVAARKLDALASVALSEYKSGDAEEL